MMSYITPGIDLPFTNGFYRSGRSLQYSAQRCVNWYPSIAKKPALSPANLYMTAGIREIVDSTAGVNRGGEKWDGKPFFVNGDKLYRIDQTILPDLTETYAAVELGTIAGGGRVIMASGRLHLVIVVPGVASYSWDGSTLAQLDGLANFRGPAQDVVQINSFYVFSQTGSNIIFHSDINDARTYNPLDFEEARQIQVIVGLLKYRNQLYVMGDEITAPYVYIGGANFVFQPQRNADIDIGIRSVYAKQNIRQQVILLGGSKNEEPGVWLFPQLQKISHEAIDNVIQNLTDSDLDNAFIIKHSQNDSDAMALIAGDECFVFDPGSGAWHERRSLNGDGLYRWRVNSIVQCYNRVIVGDYFGGQIGILDDQVNTEYGAKVRRTVTMLPINNKGAAVKLSSMLVMMDAGFSGHVELRWSNDGGYNWSTPLNRSAGALGDYSRRVQFDQLGSSEMLRVFELSTDTESKCNINKVVIK